MLNESLKQTVVITDASCFILLDKIEQLQILSELSDKVITTPEVLKEFGKPLPSWIEIRPVTSTILHQVFEERVDKGEASAIALAVETPSSMLVIDDLRGRKLAKQLNIQFTGTLGLLLKAKQLGVISLLRPILQKVQLTDFRISDQLIAGLLKEAGE